MPKWRHAGMVEVNKIFADVERRVSKAAERIVAVLAARGVELSHDYALKAYGALGLHSGMGRLVFENDDYLVQAVVNYLKDFPADGQEAIDC